MLTGVAEWSTAALCMQRGAFDHLAKPIELTDLDGAIERALERRDHLLRDHRSTVLLKDEVARLVMEVHRQQTRFDNLSVATLESLVYMMEAKSSYLAGIPDTLDRVGPPTGGVPGAPTTPPGNR
jgi:DNA-binding NtrC family response regulator